VAILSIVPKVYSQDGTDLYSPSSGTSMSAPFISNLAAQILNTNSKLTPSDIKRIVMETGSFHLHLNDKIISSAAVDNAKALKAALLSRDMALTEAINLAKSNLIPMEDKISIGQPPAITPEILQKNVMESVPQMIRPQDIDEESSIEESTSEQSSSPKDPKKEKQDTSSPLPSVDSTLPEKSGDPVPASQNEAQSPPPSGGKSASFSQSQPSPPSSQSEESALSGP
jgi:hypothetical protein